MQEGSPERREQDPIASISEKQKALYDAVNRIMGQGRTPEERAGLLKMIDTELQKVLDKVQEAGV